MGQYKLIYFNARGRAEVARLILHYAQVPFEDYRLADRAEWSQIKPQMPLGQVPVLEVDGKQLAQSHAIFRYLSRQHGLAGKNDWENALADMYGDCLQDLKTELRPINNEKDPVKKNELFKTINSEKIQPHLQKIESQLVNNGTGFLVGDSVTWPELAYYAFLVQLAEEEGEDLILGNTPHLKKLCDRIANTPQIKNYVETRPKTSM